MPMEFDIVTAPKRNSRHWKPGTVTWEEIISWCQYNVGTKKESGGYVLGTLAETTVVHKKGQDPCTNYHRTKMAIQTRCALTLDIDTPDPNFLDVVEMTLPWQALIHTTFSSTPAAPRYRLIIPLDRPVAPDEYHAAAGAVMQRLGAEQFDPGSYQPERYMFKPASQKASYFKWAEVDGDPAPVEELLEDFQQDLSDLPMPKKSHKKRNPFEIEGAVGAFNRVYEDLDFLISEYELPYQKLDEERYQLVGAAGAAGMGPVTEGIFFSHHINDPAYGVACSAFDLARLHLYGYLDEDVPRSTPINRRPSQRAMQDHAMGDSKVVAEMVREEFDDMPSVEDPTEDDTPDWRTGLRLDSRTGHPKDEIYNWDLIATHDPAFKVLQYNELTLAVEISGDLPWRKLSTGETFGEGDKASLNLHIERTYHNRPSRAFVDDLILESANRHRVNPVKDWLLTLKWDGKHRLETCLPGVAPTPYTRLVARKVLTAAVARMMEPGIKWDHMVILHGDEGLGKSYWVELMSKGYSASLGPIHQKDTLLAMQRSWIMTNDEGHALKQSEWDAQKEFITRTSDVFRAPYSRQAEVHRRHTVIWGTTNDDVFLRKQEGNRRFLIVRCEKAVDFSKITPHYVEQVWAEALYLYRQGERLWLTEEESAMAGEEREDFTEEDTLPGMVEEFVETLVPEDWDSMSPESRMMWLQNSQDDFGAKGTQQMNQVCSLQIWVEAMGRRRGDHKRTDLLEITKALKKLPGWRAVPGSHRIPNYGPQKVFERIQDEDDLI